MKWVAVAILLLDLCFMSSYDARAEPQPELTDHGYRLGPYPIELEANELRHTFWTWMFFAGSAEGRSNPTYKLSVSIQVSVYNLRNVLVKQFYKLQPSDNCGRINALDNYVWSIREPRLTIRDQHTLRIEFSGEVETWSCFENPTYYTKCDYYRDDVGIEWPKDCKLVRNAPLKARIAQQGFEGYKELELRTDNDGRIVYFDKEPHIELIGEGLGTNFLKFFQYLQTMGTFSESSLFLTPQYFELTVPDEIRALNPRYEDAYFYGETGKEFANATATMSISLSGLNSIMRRSIGSLWKDIERTSAPSDQDGTITKSAIRSKCAELAQDIPVEECAASLGWQYDALPD